jgi:hypothetical protein
MSTKEESLACIPAARDAVEQSAFALLDELDADLSAPWRSVVHERHLLSDVVQAQQLRLLRCIAVSLEKLSQRGDCAQGGCHG